MLITISGTPGTGKTTAAKIAAKKLKARLITTNYLARKYKIRTPFDKKRKTRIIDVKKLSSAARKEAKNSKLLIFEGHLSHFAPADTSIILRTSPKELEKRLKKKRWSKRKINENIEAEAIGVISSGSRNSIEIDTTKKKPDQTAAAIIKVLSNSPTRKKYSRKIDWTKEYEKYLRRIPVRSS